MAILLKGAPVAAAITERVRQKAEELSGKGIYPTLAIVRIGERKDDIAYEKSAVKRCDMAGVQVRNIVLPKDVSQTILAEKICELNADNSIHGVLIFSPLPKHIDEAEIRRTLSPAKDVDGITDGSLGSVMSGSGEGFSPCTAQACMEILDYYGIDPTGKNAVVIGRSLVVGKPAAMLLTAKNATVTLCHTKTQNLAGIASNADIIIAAVGKAKAVGAECFAQGQTVIDVGINVDGNGKMSGDADFETAEPVVDAITPVPGGVGSVTTAVLVSHVVQAAEKYAGGKANDK